MFVRKKSLVGGYETDVRSKIIMQFLFALDEVILKGRH